MSLFISSLNSGSNGNCYYIGNGREAVLIDAGISCREIENRLERLQVPVEQVKALFVSHEHADHIKGVERFSSRHQVPVYVTPATRREARLKLDKHRSFSFRAHDPVTVGGLQITAFPKQHDAVDPYSFVVSDGHTRVGVFTDIGTVCDTLVEYFRQCHAAFLEANYDEAMLDNGSYPVHLKNRIRGGQGHLSNLQALDLFNRHRPAFMSHLLLSHLSQNNNDPALVQSLFGPHASGMTLVIASRYAESPVYPVGPLQPARPPAPEQLVLPF